MKQLTEWTAIADWVKCSSWLLERQQVIGGTAVAHLTAAAAVDFDTAADNLNCCLLSEQTDLLNFEKAIKYSLEIFSLGYLWFNWDQS